MLKSPTDPDTLLKLLLLLMHVPLLSDAKALFSSNSYGINKLLTDDDHSNALSYLTRFGYLPPSDLETGFLRTEEELRDAVRQLQRFAQLPVTGQFDNETIELLHKPRCGNADILNSAFYDAKSSSDKPQHYVLGPSAWKKKAITFRIVTFTADLEYQHARDAIIRALYVWSDVTHLTFHEIQHGDADIMIQFSRGYHQDGYPFDGPGHVLAHAFFPGENRGGDIHFDDDETWTVFSETGTDLYSVASHELGHALGLSHTSQLGALMYSWYQGAATEVRLHPDDIEAIQLLYGYKEFSYPPTTPSTQKQTDQTNPPTTPDETLVLSNPLNPDIDHEDPSGRADHHCYLTGLDAISTIRRELFAFRGKFFWRVDSNGILNEQAMETTRFWFGFPKNFEGVDAVYEKQDENGTIVFFKGNRFWEFVGNQLSPGFPQSGLPLSDLGLPPEVDHIDAAFVWGYNRRAYLISGYAYWKMDTDGNARTVVQHDYPRDMNMWTGAPVPVDDAFTHTDGHLYFFQGENYWQFGDAQMSVRDGYPKRLKQRWLPCETSRTPVGGVDDRLTASTNAKSIATLHLTTCIIVWLSLDKF